MLKFYDVIMIFLSEISVKIHLNLKFATKFFWTATISFYLLLGAQEWLPFLCFNFYYLSMFPFLHFLVQVKFCNKIPVKGCQYAPNELKLFANLKMNFWHWQEILVLGRIYFISSFFFDFYLNYLWLVLLWAA